MVSWLGGFWFGQGAGIQILSRISVLAMTSWRTSSESTGGEAEQGAASKIRAR